MIPVPQTVLESLARSFGTTAAELSQFGGGREDSDGIVYAYPFGAARRLLKVLAFSIDEQRRGLLSLEERLRFMRFCGENGARIAFPLFSPQGRLYETFAFEAHLWVGYAMDVAPGKTPKGETGTRRSSATGGKRSAGCTAWPASIRPGRLRPIPTPAKPS